MFVDPDDDPRSDGGFENTERAVLLGFLTDQRLSFQLQCADLDAEQLARRSVEPSNLSLLGLLRHLAGVERIWFRRRMAGQDVPLLYRTDAEPNGDFNRAVADPAMVEEAWAAWRAEIDIADQ